MCKAIPGLAGMGLILLAATVTSNAATVSFQQAVVYPVGTRPVAIAAADFNNDGHIDLAVLNSGDVGVGNATISILLGNGDGTFQLAINFAADTNPTFIAAGDLNGDQRADLVITGASGVSVLLGNGDGTFQPPQHFDGGTSPGMIVVADLNSDHKQDLVVTNANGVSILIGNGDGTFQSRVDYSVPNPAIGTVVVGDFNGDDKPDLAVGEGFFNALSGAVDILLGNGDGTFRSAVNVGASTHVRAALDFNHDGKLDLLVDDGYLVDFNSHSVVGLQIGVMLGNGDGTFQPLAIVNQTSETNLAMAADFDGDGNSDIAVVDYTDTLDIYAGDGKGNFASAVKFELDTSGFATVRALALDLNGDQTPEVIAVNTVNDHVAVLLNSTGSDFSISASSPTPAILSGGQSATSTLTLKQLNAFNTPVSLTCSVQPAQAGAPTCALSSSSVTFDASGNATATLTITASSTAAARLNVSSPMKLRLYEGAWLPLIGFAFLGSGIGIGQARRKRTLLLLMAAVLLSAILFQSACGGGGGNGGGGSTSYSVTIAGASGATQHSTTVTVVVR